MSESQCNLHRSFERACNRCNVATKESRFPVESNNDWYRQQTSASGHRTWRHNTTLGYEWTQPVENCRRTPLQTEIFLDNIPHINLYSSFPVLTSSWLANKITSSCWYLLRLLIIDSVLVFQISMWQAFFYLFYPSLWA